MEPVSRRTGIGAQLVQDAAAWAAQRGCVQIEVVVAPNGRNVDHLHDYYATLGFIDEGRRLQSRPLL